MMQGVSFGHIRFAFYVCCLLAGITLLTHTFIDYQDEDMRYPQALLIGWIISAGCCVLVTLHQKDAPSGTNWLAFVLATCVTAAFILLLIPLGFALSAFLFFTTYAYILGYTRWRILLPSAAFVTILFYSIFEFFLQIPLPQGILG